MAYDVNQSSTRLGGARMSLGGAISRIIDTGPAGLSSLRSLLGTRGRKAADIRLSTDQYRNRISYDRLETTATLSTHAEIGEMVRELAEDRDWVMLGELLEEWDQARASCHIRRRFMHTAIWEIIAVLQEDQSHIHTNAPILRARLGDHTVAEVEAAAQDHPHLYTLSALAAQMRLSQAWDYRGEDLPETVTDQGWAKLEMAVSVARVSLDHLDAKALNSPMVAMVRFNLIPFRRNPQQRVMEAYKDWLCLDPGDLTPHVRMGTLLLPRWFGDYEMLERTALQAVSWTEHAIDATAYAVIYASALSQDHTPLLYMDTELFAEGIEDLITYRKRDPSHVPHTVQDLWRFSNRAPMLGTGAEERAEWSRRTDKMAEMANSCLMRHLTAIHPASWRGGEKAALDQISISAQEALEAGENIVVSTRGVTPVVPQIIQSHIA